MWIGMMVIRISSARWNMLRKNNVPVFLNFEHGHENKELLKKIFRLSDHLPSSDRCRTNW